MGGATTTTHTQTFDARSGTVIYLAGKPIKLNPFYI